QFQIGECLFAKKDYDEAIKALMRVRVNYAYPQWSARALLEIGRALEESQRPADAAARYRELIEAYPDTNEATIAKQRLEKLPTE
ncbi:MAG: tetratricopeptide repeat protein, partial [Rhodospirillales bacterium]|nr:tetratricopeptide repeat protein [Rhodospirillales bacterium]